MSNPKWEKVAFALGLALLLGIIVLAALLTWTSLTIGPVE